MRLPVRRNMCGGHCSLAPDIVIFPMPVETAPMKNWIPLAIAALFAVVIGLLALQGADLRREVSSGKVLDTTRVVHEQFMAMVAPDTDGIEYTGPGFECHHELALPGWRNYSWLWQREPMRTGAQ